MRHATELLDAAQRHDYLPDRPATYFLQAGEGEHGHLFDGLFTVLLSKDETDGQFGVFTSLAPKGDVIPVHVHPGVHEIFFVLDGQVRLWVQDENGRRQEKLLGPGDFGDVPARVLHTTGSRLTTPGCWACPPVASSAGSPPPARAPTPPAAAAPYVPPPEQLMRAGQEFGVDFRLHEG